MKKVNIITLQNVRNYGSVLQALATQIVFENLGCQVAFYDYYKSKNEINFYRRAYPYFNGNNYLINLIKFIILSPTFLRQDSIFQNFIDKYLNVLPGRFITENDFKHLQYDADIYVTGSDQTWNSGWNNGILPPLFLSFVPEGKRCIAYGASFGKDKLDEWEKNITKNLLKHYYAISVRESSAVKIIEDLNLDLNLNPVNVLDPTLQVEGDCWKKLFLHNVKHKKYCLLYQLNNNSDFDRFAIEFAKSKQLKLIRWCNRYDQIRLPGDIKLIIPNVSDFISYIDNADFILTDSFHCTAFCQNFNKQFLSVIPKKFGERILSLLKLTNLEHRCINDFNDESYYNMDNIDYSSINKILRAEREKTNIFLNKAIHK